jgi:predicted nucleic acid-binding protein
MIYVDTSVLLATLLTEERSAPPEFWRQTLVSSRLLSLETWNRAHASGVTKSHREQIGALLGRVALVELDARTLARAIEPFPSPVRPLDAIHLATACYLRDQGQPVAIATFDERMAKVARQLSLSLVAFAS